MNWDYDKFKPTDFALFKEGTPGYMAYKMAVIAGVQALDQNLRERQRALRLEVAQLQRIYDLPSPK